MGAMASRIRRALIAFGMFVSRGFDRVSRPGVIPGNVGAHVAAWSRWGFYIMPTNGPIEAMNRDMRGIVGGLLALAIGKPDRLATGLRGYRISAEYVHEKVRHGEVGPGTDIPILISLGRYGTQIIETYPEAFVQALESGDRRAVARAYFEQPGRVTKWFALYPVFSSLVLLSVGTFMWKALRDGPDAQKYALCQLAIMESTLTNAEKDAALAELRKTAPKTIVQFEYYVPLLVPFGGTVQDKVHRRDASGEIIDNHSVIPSVFNPQAIQISQSLCCEMISLRSFLWLYRDEQVALEKHDRETSRKFGPEVARRIAQQPRYPLPPEHISELTQAGARHPEEVVTILDGLLRERGLDAVADAMMRARQQPPL
jgi:hypothetical protein